MIPLNLNEETNMSGPGEETDPEVLEWLEQVIMKDEYYDIIEDIDFDKLVDELKERSV